MQTIQMHLYEKQINFSGFFFRFFESTLSFEHFQKKMTLIADSVSTTAPLPYLLITVKVIH